MIRSRLDRVVAALSPLSVSERLTILLTTVIAGATVWNVIVVCGTLDVLRGQLGEMKASREGVDASTARQLRAYVYANVDDRPAASAADVPYIYSVTFGNGGQTPAYHISYHLSAGFVPTNEPIAPDEMKPSPGMEGDYLFGQHVKRYSAAAVILTRDQSDAIQKGKGGIVFKGILTYNDVFQCRHYVHFCVDFFSQRGAPPSPYDCNGYNDTDDPRRCDKG